MLSRRESNYISSAQKTAEVPQNVCTDHHIHVPVLKHLQWPAAPVIKHHHMLVPRMVQKHVEELQTEHFDHHIHVPVQMHCDVPVITKDQELADLPQTEVVERIVETPVQQHVQMPMTQKIQRMVDAPQTESGDQQIYVPAQGQRQMPVDMRMQGSTDVPQTETNARLVEASVQKQAQIVQWHVQVPRTEYIDHHIHVAVHEHEHAPVITSQWKFADLPQMEAAERAAEMPVQEVKKTRPRGGKR